MKKIRMTAYDVALEREAQQLTGREAGIYGPCPPTPSTRKPFGHDQALINALRPVTRLTEQHRIAQAWRTQHPNTHEQTRAQAQREAALKANAAKAERLAKAEARKAAKGAQESLSTVPQQNQGTSVDNRVVQTHLAPVTPPRLVKQGERASLVHVAPINIRAFDDASVVHDYTFINWGEK